MPVAVIKPRSVVAPAGSMNVKIADKCSYEGCQKSGGHYIWFLDHEYARFRVCTDHKEEFEGILKGLLG